MHTLSSLTRVAVGLVALAIGSLIAALLMVLVLPSRVARVKVGNYYGKTVSRFCLWITGSPLTTSGAEHLNRHRPAIYVSNHTSIADIFIASSLSPVGTVGIAKKEVVYYPFFGQLYLLSGHLRIDRGNSDAARASMAELGRVVREKGLSIFLWPEGTRSKDGRLLPLKKGLVYLAIQTGLPVVPMVVIGAHKALQKHSLRLTGAPIEVRILPAIDTSAWTADDVETPLQLVQERIIAALPEEQRPLDKEQRRSARG